MKIFLFPFLLLLSQSLFAQDWFKDTVELKGDVKHLHHEAGYYDGERINFWFIKDNYNYNRQGFLTKSVSSNSMGGDNFNTVFRVYNEDETLCLIDYSYYDDDDTSSCHFEYDSLGRAARGLYYHEDIQYSTFNYVYNELGLLAEYFAVIKRNGDTIRTLYKYDDEGRKIIEQHFSTNSHDLDELITWKFDNHGHLLEEKLLDLNPSDKTIITTESDGTRHTEIKKATGIYGEDSYRITYTYNQRGQVTHRIKTNLEGLVEFDIHLMYNEQGDVLTEKHAKTNDNEEGAVIHVYVYDHKGNWITKTSTWNGEPDWKEIRKIDYY
jgi:hypothetical protein